MGECTAVQVLKDVTVRQFTTYCFVKRIYVWEKAYETVFENALAITAI